jgi:acetyl esterase/lipase
MDSWTELFVPDPNDQSSRRERPLAFALDPQVAAAMEPLTALAVGLSPPSVGDVATRRMTMEAGQVFMESKRVMPTDVKMADFETRTSDGATVALRWYAKDGSAPGSAGVYLHGGGMILSNIGLYDGTVARYVSTSGVPMLSVEYRYAPENPGLTPVEDSYVALRWLADHSAELGVEPGRIAVMGDSAGGGIAAGLALLARDRGGPSIAQQILVYPMLDDRTTIPDPELLPFAGWTYEDNLTGWSALLGEALGGPNVSAYAAPARMADGANLPPVYIEVGELDIFRNECIEFARRTTLAGVSTEVHVHPGVPHGWDVVAPQADVTKRAMDDRIRRLQSL